MLDSPRIYVLYGGCGPEREVSIWSGEAVIEALGNDCNVVPILLDEELVPEPVRAADGVVFPVIHGEFGEDGRLQGLLEVEGIEFAGCDASSSRTCMNKVRSKKVAVERGLTTPKSMHFDGSDVPLADEVIAELGTSLVIKPADQGSSVGLTFTEHRSALGVALSQIHSGNWMIEQRIEGRELTVGMLEGKAMGIVEIVSASGVYDYEAKYTSGTTTYYYPADLSEHLTAKIQREAERLFDACGCRDFARVDFLLAGGEAYFLEINTLPGMTATSLLPKSASCVGMSFKDLVGALLAPAIARYQAKHEGDAG